MRETRADTQQAVLAAALLHALLFGLMLAGLWWTRSVAPQSAAGEPVEAELIDPNALSARLQRVLAKRPEPVAPQREPRPQPLPEPDDPVPQPLPEPRPEQAPAPPQPRAQHAIVDPDPISQEEVRADALSAETREREQQAKQRQEQIDLTERERQKEAEQQRKLAEIRREREKLEREIALSEQRLQQIADRNAAKASAQQATSNASPPPGNSGEDKALLAQYMAAIQRSVLGNWTRPDNMPNLPCRIAITQLPGGEVISAEVEPGCPYDDLAKRSVEAAVLKAQPLPYAGFEPVFSRKLVFTFRPSGP